MIRLARQAGRVGADTTTGYHVRPCANLSARPAAAKVHVAATLASSRFLSPPVRMLSTSAPRRKPPPPPQSPPMEDGRDHSEGNDEGMQSFSDPHFGLSQQRREPPRRKSKRELAQEEIEQERRQREQREAKEEDEDDDDNEGEKAGLHEHEHAVISTFDLFSIGIGPSSSHTVGPLRAGAIFANDLIDAGLLDRVARIKIALYGSLAATGEGHMTPSALLLGLEGADCETIETDTVPIRFEGIKQNKELVIGRDMERAKGGKRVRFDYDKDLLWEWGVSLPLHSNGLRLTVFSEDGTMLATNDLFSVGGGFVVNGALSTANSPSSSSSSAKTDEQSPTEAAASAESEEALLTTAGELGSALETPEHHPADLGENLFYKQIRRTDAAPDRRSGADTRATQADTLTDGIPRIGGQDVEVTAGAGKADGGGPSLDSEASKKAAMQPPYPFRNAASLLSLCKEHNLTIAQLVYENESHWYSGDEIRSKLLRIWDTMDNCIREGVQSTEKVLPGSLGLQRRAPGLYRRLTRGLYPSSHYQLPPQEQQQGQRGRIQGDGAQQPAGIESTSSSSAAQRASTELATSSPSAQRGTTSTIARSAAGGPPRVHGRFDHYLFPTPPRRTTFPAIDYLSVYAIAVNEVNAAGGRVVTAPTNGAAGILPSVAKYVLEFISEDTDGSLPSGLGDGAEINERDIFTFMLTASAIGMLYKRGATISAAEGGCMAEVGVACSMAAGAFAACMGASPETILAAAEVGIEHNLGLTCDPIGGLVQAPCVERNALGAVKAVVAANLALASPKGSQRVSLDEAIHAMRLTAKGMRNEFKETSLSGLAKSVSTVQIPVSVPDC